MLETKERQLPSLVRRAAGSRSGSREGWFQSRNSSAWEPPLARSRLRLDHAALLTKEGNFPII